MQECRSLKLTEYLELLSTLIIEAGSQAEFGACTFQLVQLASLSGILCLCLLTVGITHGYHILVFNLRLKIRSGFQVCAANPFSLSPASR